VSSNKLESWLDAQEEELKELTLEQKKATKQHGNKLKVNAEILRKLKSLNKRLNILSALSDSRLQLYECGVFKITFWFLQNIKLC
jgi:hypothetical protein